jgi:hypothetical protein
VATTRVRPAFMPRTMPPELMLAMLSLALRHWTSD